MTVIQPPQHTSFPPEDGAGKGKNITLLETRFSRHFPHFLDAITLGKTAPAESMSLAEWSNPETFSELLTRYSHWNYRNHPDQPLLRKPVVSLWAQWYLGLLLPPLLLAVLPQPEMFDCSHQCWRVSFNESGRPAQFWWDVREIPEDSIMDSRMRIETLIHQHLVPVMEAIAQQGEISSRLLWCNTGVVVHWFLTATEQLLGSALKDQLTEALFFSRQLSDDRTNPFYQTMRRQAGKDTRRACCLRYQLPDVQACENCSRQQP